MQLSQWNVDWQQPKTTTNGGAKFYCIANVIINLGILGIYKYYNFFIDSATVFVASLGFEAHLSSLNLILPVGISFYTFQALSYTIDVYKGKLDPTRDIVSFFAFLSFFPQLVAGPIERAANLLPQFQKSRQFKYDQAVDGTRQILWGLFKKMVVADNCADIVNKVWGDYNSYSSLALVLSAILFAFQIYGDFSGYSDIAIGTAKLFGIMLRRNFNVPYFSRDIAEFWRRWHISLNTWFVDYIYISLGGSREGKSKAIRNTFVIFLLSGLWHGANWTFVLWGAFHAVCFLPLLIFGQNRRFRNNVATGRMLPTINEATRILSTFALAVFGWIIFRADSISDFYHYIGCMVKHYNIENAPSYGLTFLFIALLVIVEWINREKEHPFQISISSRPLRWSVYILLALLCLTQSGQQVELSQKFNLR